VGARFARENFPVVYTWDLPGEALGLARNLCGKRMTTSAWGGSSSSMTRLKRGRFKVDAGADEEAWH
jgi:hypothetical protein